MARTIDTMRPLIKIVVAVAVIWFAWTQVVPWARNELGSSPSTSTGSDDDGGCRSAALRATNAWGEGLGRFGNPPYDLTAWSSFRGGVESKIGEAQSACNCGDDSCREVRSALSDLRSLVGEFDGAIRNGSPPPADAVQRQERIDNVLSR
jgi:hypothetical protein